MKGLSRLMTARLRGIGGDACIALRRDRERLPHSFNSNPTTLFEPFKRRRVVIYGHAEDVMGHDRNAETLVDSLEKFRRLVLDKLRQKLRCGEEQAEEAGQTIVDEFRVGAESFAEPLLVIRFVCEPGKAARVITVDGPRDCSALFSDDEPPSTTRH